MIDFIPFPKMARLSRDMIVTEKIDGTNAQIYIEPISRIVAKEDPNVIVVQDIPDGDGVNESYVLGMYTGSRSRWITPASDNFGFSKWCLGNARELFKLGQGRHFGEWWGSGIQRGYDLPKGEKRFSLFNALRWIDGHGDKIPAEKQEYAPGCCHVVPVLFRGIFSTDAVADQLDALRFGGSVASPGFMKPEGVVAFHIAGNFGLKKTIEKDYQPKGK